MKHTNGLLMVGVFMIAAGALGFAIPVFATRQTDTVARTGDLKIQTTEDTSHRIPQLLSGARSS